MELEDVILNALMRSYFVLHELGHALELQNPNSKVAADTIWEAAVARTTIIETITRQQEASRV